MALQKRFGAPKTVTWGVCCSHNQLTSFKDITKKAGWYTFARNPMVLGEFDEILKLNGIEYKFKDHIEMKDFIRNLFRTKN